MKKQSKKTVKDTRGRSRETGALDGSASKPKMFPVTCADGLWQCRYRETEKAELEKRADSARVPMAALFTIDNVPFKNQTRQELKVAARKLGYLSLAHYVQEKILNQK